MLAASCGRRFLGRPGRSSSYSPSSRCCTTRCRHLPTVALFQRRRRVIWVLLCPSADHNTSRATADQSKVRCGKPLPSELLPKFPWWIAPRTIRSAAQMPREERSSPVGPVTTVCRAAMAKPDAPELLALSAFLPSQYRGADVQECLPCYVDVRRTSTLSATLLGVVPEPRATLPLFIL